MTSQKLPRARKSIAHLPSPDITNEVQDKENATTDLSGAHQLGSAIVKAFAVNKKLRSKSLGPGGLEALKEETGNKRKVGLRMSICRRPRSALMVCHGINVFVDCWATSEINIKTYNTIVAFETHTNP